MTFNIAKEHIIKTPMLSLDLLFSDSTTTSNQTNLIISNSLTTKLDNGLGQLLCLNRIFGTNYTKETEKILTAPRES
ncbi:hypothetical protein G9A89_009474 [Geosiphon pyriformis]|nr:hypothetical protein G9A89_009474 [Geosiphon pyriformis]